MSSILPFAYFQGAIGPFYEARVSLACNSLQYGTTCFGGIRGYIQGDEAKVFRLRDHYQRLMNSSKILGFNYYISYEEFHSIIEELIIKNQPATDFYIRPFIFAADESLSPKPIGLNFDLAIYLVPLGHYFNQQQGMKLMISSWRKFPDSSLPTKAKAGGCYINSFMATSEALHNGFDEALLMDQEGYIVEASVANLLLRYRDSLLMPEIGSSLLEGITMRSVITLLQDEGYQINFGRIDRSIVYTCNELLLLGTAAQVAFAQSIDGRPIGDKGQSKICKLLRSKFKEIIEGNHLLSKEWMSRFSINCKERVA